MIDNIFVEISLIIFIAIGIAAIVKLLRQPLIIGYIITGIIVSPYALNLISSPASLAPFAQFGVALLLFMVGLNLNPKVIKDMGKVALITGLGQIIFTGMIGFLILKLLGYSTLTSSYVALALAFSSTIIVIKLFSDTGNMETLHGRIVIGFLIVQDLIAMLTLMIVASLSSEASLSTLAFWTLMKGIGLLLVLFLLSLYAIPRLTKYIAKSQEFLLLFSLGWCLALATLFYFLKFLPEAGALVAGVTLSLSPYRYEISAKLRPIRDFFLVLFFVALGSQMVVTDFSKLLLPIVLLSLFVLIGNPLVLMILMGILGYTKRTSFLSGLAVAQVSEFSFILIALGIKVGHLAPETLSLVAFVGLITIAGSSYFILYGRKIYTFFSPVLGVFERKGIKVDEKRHHPEDNYDIILFGYNRIGYDLLESFQKLKKKFLVVDYNPEIIAHLARQGLACRYGDATDTELLRDLNLAKAKMVVSTIPELETNLLILNKAKEHNKKSVVIMVSHQIDETMKLYDEGATYVIMPHFLGGHHTSTMIEEYGLNLDKFIKEKAHHLHHLRERKRIGHEHPPHERG